MDLINDLTITTCLYYDLFGTEFGGRHGPRYKYFYGLLSMLKMDCPVVLYCWEKDIQEIKDFIDTETNGTRNGQVHFEIFDLYQSPLYEKIKSVKNIEEQKKSDRSFDVSINKMVMLKRTIESNPFNSKYFYFIDAGLSSSSLFPNKYLTNQEDPVKRYYECSLFTPTVSKNLIKLAEEDKMVLWKISQWTNYIDQTHCTRNNGDSIIAGIFGSTADTVRRYADDVIERFTFIVQTYKTLYLEEPIMTILYQENPEKYKTINFDVWYHENSGDVFQPMIVGKKSFFNTFEELNQ
jgi:hypothetical protein